MVALLDVCLINKDQTLYSSPSTSRRQVTGGRPRTGAVRRANPKLACIGGSTRDRSLRIRDFPHGNAGRRCRIVYRKKNLLYHNSTIGAAYITQRCKARIPLCKNCHAVCSQGYIYRVSQAMTITSIGLRVLL